MRTKRLAVAAAVALGFCIGYIWLALWVDGRNQRLYREAEDRHWMRERSRGLARRMTEAEERFGQY